MAFVAATKLESTTGNNCSGAIAAPTAGNALFCCSAADGVNAGGTVTISDTKSNTWTNDTHAVTAGGAGNEGDGCISSSPNVAGGATTLTATNTAAAFGVSCSVLEFSGLPTSAISDAASPAVKTGTVALSTLTAVVSNALTNATADALYIGFLLTDAGPSPTLTGTTAAFTYSGGTGDTHGDGMTELDGANYSVWNASYAIVSSVASRTVGWNITVSGLGDYGIFIAVYKLATATDPFPLAYRPWYQRAPANIRTLLARFSLWPQSEIGLNLKTKYIRNLNTILVGLLTLNGKKVIQKHWKFLYNGMLNKLDILQSYQ